MRPYISICILLCFIVASNAQSLKVADFPAEVLVNDPGVITVFKEHKVKVKSDKKVIESVHHIYTLFEQDEGFNVIYYENSFQEVKNLSAKIYDANGTVITEIKKKEIIDHAYIEGVSDSRVKAIPTSYGVLPYTVEISYDKIHKGIMFYPDFDIQWPNEAVISSSYSIETPAGFDIQYKQVNIDQEVKIDQDENNTTHSWTVTNISKPIFEKHSSPVRKNLPKVMISPHDFSIEGYKGSMTSWNDFGDFMYRLNEGRQKLDPGYIKEILELTKTAKTDHETVAILYKYLQDNFRYVSIQLGIGGWKAEEANFVFKNKYGDCKGLSNLMVALLSVKNIEAHPVLIYSGKDEQFVFEDFVKPNFNHEVIYIPSQDMFLECTSNSAPLGYMGRGTQGKKGLMFSSDGGTFLEVPKSTDQQNVKSVHAEIKLSLKGNASIKLKEVRKGTTQESIRYYESDLSEKELNEMLSENTSINGGVLSNLNVDVSNESPVVELDYTAKSSRYCRKAGRRYFLPLNNIDRIIMEVDEGVRRTDIVNNFSKTEELNIVYNLSDNFQTSGFEEYESAFESKFGKYIAEAKIVDQTLVYNRTFIYKEFSTGPSEFEAFKEFFKKVNLEEKKKVTLELKSTVQRP